VFLLSGGRETGATDANGGSGSRSRLATEAMATGEAALTARHPEVTRTTMHSVFHASAGL